MNKILVIHSWGIGDMLMATPMLRSLKLSGYSIDLAILSPANKIILKDNNFIDNIFLVESKFTFFKFFRKYDYLVATAGTNPKKIKLLNFLIGAKKVFSSLQEKDIHRIDMNLKIVSSLITTKEKEPYIYITKNRDILDKYIIKDKKNIGFAVGSGSNQKFKRWNKYRELIEKIDGNKLLFIGPDEIELEKEFESLDVTIVKEKLEDTIKIVANLDFLIGNDNGVMHIGYATKVNTLTIVGMTNEKETCGYRENNHNIFLDMKCRPCFDSDTDRVGCKTLDCLRDLSVEKVCNECQKYL